MLEDNNPPTTIFQHWNGWTFIRFMTAPQKNTMPMKRSEYWRKSNPIGSLVGWCQWRGGGGGSGDGHWNLSRSITTRARRMWACEGGCDLSYQTRIQYKEISSPSRLLCCFYTAAGIGLARMGLILNLPQLHIARAFGDNNESNVPIVAWRC